MINLTRNARRVSELTELSSREIQLFEPPADALYTIDGTSRIVDLPRHRILVYCKYRLLSPANTMTEHGYYFNGNAVRTLRRIEALRTVCGDDFAGIKMILDLTADLERLRSDIRLLSRARGVGSSDKSDRNAASAPRRRDARSSSRQRWK
jgi:DNA-binding transcriptional MerR regulator